MAYTGKLQLFRGVPLNIGNEDTLYFSSRTEQDNYFSGLAGITFPRDPSVQDFKFIREEGYVKVYASHDYLENCNYMRFQNEDLSGQQTTRKWYYAFITGLRYISDSVTAVYFTLDVLQTWLPKIDYNLNQCFIERMHATSDEIGDNVATETVRAFKSKTYEETVDTVVNQGFYVAVAFMYQNGWFSTRLEISETTYGGLDYSTILGTSKMDGTVTASNILLFKITNTNGDLDEDGLTSLRTAIKQTNVLTSQDYIDIDAITNMYLIPAALVDENVLVDVSCGSFGSSLWTAKMIPNRYRQHDGSTWYDYPVTLLKKSISPNFNMSKIGTFEPKNKKLLTSQFTTYQIVNADGNTAVFEPEGFTKEVSNTDVISSPDFAVTSSILPPAKLAILPISGTARQKYYGSVQSNEQIFPFGELPGVTVAIDTYRDWIARQVMQKVQTVAPIALGAIGAYGELTGAAFTKGMTDLSRTGKPLYGAAKQAHTNKLVGQAKSQAFKSATDNILSMNSVERELRSANNAVSTERPVPICAGNGNNLGSTLLANGAFNISIRKVAPVETELTRIDDYFTAYGYAMNVIGTPHVKIRDRFTYIKTRGARHTPKYDANNTDGIPAEYMEEINNLFDTGVRFWKTKYFLDDLTTRANGILPQNEWDN